MAGVLVTRRDVAAGQGAYTSAQALFEEALSLARPVSQGFVAGSLHDLGELSLYQRDYDAANVRFEESLAVARRVGDEYQVAYPAVEASPPRRYPPA